MRFFGFVFVVGLCVGGLGGFSRPVVVDPVVPGFSVSGGSGEVVGSLIPESVFVADVWVSVDLVWGASSDAGMCLEFVSKFVGDPARVVPSAWEGWLLSGQEFGRELPGVPVVLWFEHFGWYGDPVVFKNWGHVAVWVPGVGVVSSPRSGSGSEVFGSVEEVEAEFSSSYVGFSYDVAGFPVSWVE